MAESKYEKFYETELFMWVLLFLYTPIGLLLLWFKQHYNAIIRSIITMIFLIMYLQFERYYTDIRGFVIVLALAGLLIWNYERNKRIRRMALIDLHNIKGNTKIKEKLLNFIEKYDSPTCNYYQLIYFERYIEEKKTLSYTRKWFRTNDQVYAETVYKKIDIHTEVKVDLTEDEKKRLENYFDDYFTLLYKHVKGEYKFKSNVGGFYLIWRLVRAYSVMEYAYQFHKDYDSNFKMLNKTSLKDYIIKFTKFDFFNYTDESNDLTKFLYYLMVYGPLEGEGISNLISCYKKVNKEVEKNIKKREEKYFVNRLSKDYLSDVEFETFENVDSLPRKLVELRRERFMIYIENLFKKLGYLVEPFWRDDSDFNIELDVLIERDNERIGIIVFVDLDDLDDQEIKEYREQKLQTFINTLKNQQLHNALVITNGFFTDNERNIAKSLNINLWNQEDLEEKESRFIQTYINKDKYTYINNDDNNSKIESKKNKVRSILDIDLMSGLEFEHFLEELFRKKGFKSKVTKGSGDFGVDVIIEKGGIRYGIQAKRYNYRENKVGVKAVSQVAGGLSVHKLNKGLVVTNSYFTPQAKIIAKANHIELYDREWLENEISKAYHEKKYF